MKKDGILIGTILLVALALWLGIYCLTPGAEQVRVTLDGNVFGTYALDKPQTITLPHHTLKIEDGAVSVVKSDCTGQDCVQTSPISHGNQVIVCLPYRLNVQIMAKSDNLDTMTY